MTGRDAPPARSSSASAHSVRRDPISICRPLVEWLGSMAVAHNCGSRNKTLRDLLCLYAAFSDADLARVNDVGEGGGEERGDDGGEKCVLDIHITRLHVEWLTTVADKRAVSVSTLLSRLVKFAKDELNEEYVFETHVRCAKSTVDLYSDCGIYSSLS